VHALLIADATATATVCLAIGTFSLAAATVALAAITHRGNVDAREATADQLKASADQLEASYRPVIVPFQRSAESLKYRGGLIPVGGGPTVTGNPVERRDLPRYSAASLPVENVGTGPAMNVRGTFAGPRGKGTTRFPSEAIAPGARGIVVFENWSGASLEYTGNDESVSAVIKYDDVAGTVYRTEVTFDIGHNAYRSKLV
jgi:hypothetical protein